MNPIKLVAVDMDGTFLNDQKKYDVERFSKVYQQMRFQNIRFIVASGNQYYQLKSFFPTIEDEISFVAENGAYLVENGKELFCGSFDRKDVEKIIKTLRHGHYRDLNFLICGRESAYVFPNQDKTWFKKMQHHCHRLKIVEDLSQVNDKLFKFALDLSDDHVEVLMTDINTRHKGVATATCSGYGLVDLIVPGLHKGHGMAFFQKRWNIKPSEVLAFGDGGNDIEMLIQSGFSFAMSNAPEKVKKFAKYQAPSNNEHGVIQILENMVIGKYPFNKK